MKLNISEEHLREQKAEIIRQHIAEGKTAFVYGASHTADCTINYLKEHGIHTDFMKTVDDEYINDRTDLVPFSTYLERYARNSVLIIGFYNYFQAQKIIQQYSNIIPYIYELGLTLPYTNDNPVKWSFDFVQQHFSEFEQTFDLLEDPLSKNTMNAFINASLTGNLDLLLPYHDQDQYFNSLTDSLPMNLFVDCGAYDGDSVQAFLRHFPEYEEIIALEPDPANVQKFKNRIQSEQIERISLIEKGAYSETTQLHFQQSQTSSNFSDTGELSIDVVKLDDILSTDHKVSFIKMDIEGSELAALHGAENVIRRDKPCLAICVYHKVEDLIEIPPFIRSLTDSDSYRYYLRYHGNHLTELVFYAIPINQ